MLLFNKKSTKESGQFSKITEKWNSPHHNIILLFHLTVLIGNVLIKYEEKQDKNYYCSMYAYKTRNYKI
jgi:hypothetical protein